MESFCSTIVPDNLKATFGGAYYECAVVPRRFVIDISQGANSNFNSQDDSNQVLLVVEVHEDVGESVLCRQRIFVQKIPYSNATFLQLLGKRHHTCVG